MENLEQKTFDFTEEPENTKPNSYKTKKKMSTTKKVVYGLIAGTALAGVVGGGCFVHEVYKFANAMEELNKYYPAMKQLSPGNILNNLAGSMLKGSNNEEPSDSED